jgi:hypothetical protein
VIALGGNGSAAGGRSFMKRHKLTSARPMFDAAGRSWALLGAPYQPYAVLVGTDGEIIESWSGEIDTAAVLEALPTV